jgi:copper oxidase (laccase) domain-containing protein
MRIFTSTTTDGNMDFRFGERGEVEENRKKFFEKCGLPAGALVVVLQVTHGERIIRVSLEQDAYTPERLVRLDWSEHEEIFSKKLSVLEGVYASCEEAVVCEALVTSQPGVPLMLLTADCYPCVIYDPVRQVVALLHLGWKPTGLRLVEKVVAHMQKEYGSVPQDLEVHFGPGIAKESYVAESPSQIHDPAWQPYLFDAHDRAGMHVDILGYARAQCVVSGVLSSNIHESGIDTYGSLDYFSHYRATRTGAKNGRFATVVVL